MFPRRMQRSLASCDESGIALLGVLWTVVLLCAVVYGLLYSTQIDLRVAKNFGDRKQAYYLAVSGIEKAKALIHDDIEERKKVGTTYRSTLRSDDQSFRDVKFGRGLYRVFRTGDTENGEEDIVYGLDDEESRLSVNAASAEELAKIRGIEPDIAAAIVDWRDGDEEVTAQGAEQSYYASLANPYEMRNGAIETVRELLMVRGVTSERLLREDANASGVLDAEEMDRGESPPNDNGDRRLDRGWSKYLSLHAQGIDRNAQDRARINLQSATEDELSQIEGISSSIAAAIVAHRGNNQLESLADLLEVRQPNPNANSDGNEGEGNQNQNQTTGAPLISEALLKSIADKVTINTGSELPGVVNVNTASVDVLRCLPGVSDQMAQDIINERKRSGVFETVAHLFDVSGMDVEKFKRIEKRVTVRSNTYRILSEGYIPSTRARHRIEAVLRMGPFRVETLQYRDDL